MKKQILAAAFAFILMALAMVSTSKTAFASEIGSVMTINVPFDFYVANKRFAAGTYQIRQTSDKVFLIRNVETKTSTIVSALALAKNTGNVKTEKIVFHRVGKQSFLRGIYNERRNAGLLIGESKSERRAKERAGESQENLAQNEVKAEIVEVPAN